MSFRPVLPSFWDPRVESVLVSSNECVPLISRRTFVAVSAVTLASCRSKAPRAPTRSSGSGDILDTDDGALVIDPTDPQRGPRDAHAVLVVFSDFECPFCRDMAIVLERVHKELPKKTRLVFKHLPIPQHPKARQAAIAAQVVFLEAGSDAFWRFHDRCFAHPHDLEVDRLNAWALDEGVKADAMTKRGPDAERIVNQHVAQAERLNIRGTPRLYINRRPVGGAFPYEQIREWVDEEL